MYDGDAWKKEHLPLRPYAGKLYPEIKFNNYRYFDDFTYNGHKYNLNSIVQLSSDAQKFLGIDNKNTQLIQHEITNMDKERWGYIVKQSSDKTWHVFTTVTPEQLIEKVVIPAEPNKETQNIEYYQDNQVNGMLQMWAYYILAIVVATLFNDRIMLWCIASCLFFGIREQKLKKPPRHNYNIK